MFLSLFHYCICFCLGCVCLRVGAVFMNTEVIISDSSARIMDINNYIKEEIAIRLQIEYAFSSGVDHTVFFKVLRKIFPGINHDNY